MWWRKKKQLPTPEDIETDRKEAAFEGLRLMSELVELFKEEKELPARLLDESEALWRNAMAHLIHQIHIRLNRENYTSLTTYTGTILCLGYMLCCREKVKEKVKDGSP